MNRERVTWRGTPGVGDCMWALNCCHTYAAHHDVYVQLEMHWEHGEDYYHHFEDPETIIERMEYIHHFYAQQDRVKIVHKFNSNGRYSDWKFDDDVMMEENGIRRISAKSGKKPKNRFWFESGTFTDEQEGEIPDSDFIFRRSCFQEINPRRVVIWRPLFNAELPRTWKRLFTDDDWGIILRYLKDNGFHVHEITYRTPIREAMYLISTSRLILCYDGMWHYMGKMFARPMAVISSEGITKYHTPNALRLSPKHDYADKNVWYWFHRFGDMLGLVKKKAVEYENRMRTLYGDD